jgi:hypothetical protein
MKRFRPASHYIFEVQKKVCQDDTFADPLRFLPGRRALRSRLKGDKFMHLVVKLIIFGWIATFAMVAAFALSESGKTLKIRRRVAAWLRAPAGPASSRISNGRLQADEEDVA